MKIQLPPAGLLFPQANHLRLPWPVRLFSLALLKYLSDRFIPQKIKNLLWAGPHASFDHHVSQTVIHPPTLSQLGTAIGYCAAKCIIDKRLPRTLAKKGHIEALRSELEKLNHKVNHFGLDDELDLTVQSEVTSSTTWSSKNIQNCHASLD